MSVEFDIQEPDEPVASDTAQAFKDFDEETIAQLVSFAFEKLYLDPETELSIAVVDDAEMERIHIEWMDLKGPTDVMSFPMDELVPGTPENPSFGVLGDIVLCPSVAAFQAKNAGHSTLDEYCLLTMHGILHCLGYDHGTPEEEAEMFGLQRKLLEEFLGKPAPVETRF